MYKFSRKIFIIACSVIVCISILLCVLSVMLYDDNNNNNNNNNTLIIDNTTSTSIINNDDAITIITTTTTITSCTTIIINNNTLTNSSPCTIIINNNTIITNDLYSYFTSNNTYIYPNINNNFVCFNDNDDKTTYIQMITYLDNFYNFSYNDYSNVIIHNISIFCNTNSIDFQQDSDLINCLNILNRGYSNPTPCIIFVITDIKTNIMNNRYFIAALKVNGNKNKSINMKCNIKYRNNDDNDIFSSKQFNFNVINNKNCP